MSKLEKLRSKAKRLENDLREVRSKIRAIIDEQRYKAGLAREPQLLGKSTGMRRLENGLTTRAYCVLINNFPELNSLGRDFAQADVKNCGINQHNTHEKLKDMSNCGAMTIAEIREWLRP